MKEKTFQIIDKQEGYRGFLKLNRYQVQHSSYRGGLCQPVIRERMEGAGVVSVLLFDPILDEIVLVEQFRIGLVDQVDPPWCLETVSGFCDKANEEPRDVAIREIKEETGCDIKAIEFIGAFYVSPGLSVEKLNLYCACVDASKAEGIHGLPEEGEEIKVVRMPWKRAQSEIFKSLDSTSIVVAMQWLIIHREELVKRWASL